MLNVNMLIDVVQIIDIYGIKEFISFIVRSWRMLRYLENKEKRNKIEN